MGNFKRNDIKVGIFVSLGLITVLLSILLFGGDRLLLASTYHLKMEIRDVQGLAKGSIVTMAGLRVGNVRKLEFNPKTNKMDIVMNIERQYQQQITTEARASLKTQGALGDRYVYIEPRASKGEVLVEGAYIPVQDSGDLFDTLSARGAEFANILDVIKEVRQFVRNLNDNDRSAKFMENMAVASQNLNALLAESRAALKDVRGSDNDPRLREAMIHLSNVMKKIDRGQGTLGALINDSALHDRLMSFLGENPRNKYMRSLLRQSIQDEDKNKR